MKGSPPSSPIGAVLAQAGNVEAELRAAVDVPDDALLVLVPRYYGMSRSEAIRFRFGSDEVPAGLTAVLMTNALPPAGVSVGWWSLPRDSEAFRAAADACTRLAVGLSAAGLYPTPRAARGVGHSSRGSNPGDALRLCTGWGSQYAIECLLRRGSLQLDLARSAGVLLLTDRESGWRMTNHQQPSPPKASSEAEPVQFFAY